MATLQQSGIGTLAYPFYVNEFGRDTKPAPTGDNATLFILETHETWVWKNGNWYLKDQQAQVLDPAILVDVATSLRKIVRELRLIRRGQIEASTCKEYEGSYDDLDCEESTI
jgi:hypothetical protein